MVYWSSLDLCTTACLRFGTHNIIRIIYVVRCVTLETIWMERNSAIYRPTPTSPPNLPSLEVATFLQATFHITAHLQRLRRVTPLNTQLQLLCDLNLTHSNTIPPTSTASALRVSNMTPLVDQACSTPTLSVNTVV